MTQGIVAQYHHTLHEVPGWQLQFLALCAIVAVDTSSLQQTSGLQVFLPTCCTHVTILCFCAGPRAGGPNGNAPVSTTAHHIGRSSPARAASLRRKSMDDEVEISSGTDTDEDGALIEKARQAAEQKRAPPKKRGPTSMALNALLLSFCLAVYCITNRCLECSVMNSRQATNCALVKYQASYQLCTCQGDCLKLSIHSYSETFHE